MDDNFNADNGLGGADPIQDYKEEYNVNFEEEVDEGEVDEEEQEFTTLKEAEEQSDLDTDKAKEEYNSNLEMVASKIASILKLIGKGIGFGVVAVATFLGSAVRGFIFGDSRPFNIQDQVEKEKKAEKLKEYVDRSPKADDNQMQNEEQTQNEEQNQEQNQESDIDRKKREITSEITTKLFSRDVPNKKDSIAAQMGVNIKVEHNKSGEPSLYVMGKVSEKAYGKSRCYTNLYDTITNSIDNENSDFDSNLVKDIMKYSKFEKALPIVKDKSFVLSRQDLACFCNAFTRMAIIKTSIYSEINPQINPRNNDGGAFTKDNICKMVVGGQVITASIDRNFATKDGSSQTEMVFKLGDKEFGRLDLNKVLDNNIENKFNLANEVAKISNSLYGASISSISNEETTEMLNYIDAIVKDNEINTDLNGVSKLRGLPPKSKSQERNTASKENKSNNDKEKKHEQNTNGKDRTTGGNENQEKDDGSKYEKSSNNEQESHEQDTPKKNSRKDNQENQEFNSFEEDKKASENADEALTESQINDAMNDFANIEDEVNVSIFADAVNEELADEIANISPNENRFEETMDLDLDLRANGTEYEEIMDLDSVNEEEIINEQDFEEEDIEI